MAVPKMRVEGVKIVYRSKDGHPVLACGGIEFAVNDGEFVSIVGPSGCGKTTLLYAIDGLVPVYEGQIVLDGKRVTKPGPDRAVVFQTASLFPWRTVRKNIIYGLEIKGKLGEKERARVEWLIDLVELRGFENRIPSELSGGMQQRVNLARALAVEPKVMLLDEPFAALDAQTREMLQVELSRVSAETRQTMMFVTHDITESVFLSDRVVVLSQRPSQVREIVTIDLPKPRSVAMKDEPKFLALVSHIRKLIET